MEEACLDSRSEMIFYFKDLDLKFGLFICEFKYFMLDQLKSRIFMWKVIKNR